MKTIPYGVLLLTAAIHLTETYAAHDLPAALAAVAHGQRLAATGAGDSSAPWVSADGRYVVFSSLAPNLVTNDPNGGLDVFRFDRSTKALQLVSIERTGQGAGNGRSTCLGISSDANRILFQSEATNLVANDTNGLSDVFVRDLSNGDTRLVSLDNAGLPAGPFLNSSLSSDGTLLLFEAMPRAWTTNAATAADVYVRDLSAGTNFLISVATNGYSGGNGHSENAVLSGGGRWIAFQSRATNLATNDTNTRSDIYLADLQTAGIWLVSQDPGGQSPASGASKNPAISSDGNYVAFESTALALGTNSVPGGAVSVVYLRDIAANVTTCVSLLTDNLRCYRPVISPDGRYVVYESGANLCFWDSVTRSAAVLTTNTVGLAANDISHSPHFTRDSRYCFFLSSATDLSPGITNLYQSQVYRRDMLSGEIQVVSTGTTVKPGHAGATAVDVSDDGSVIVFQSADSELVDGDFNEAEDVFARDNNAGSIELISGRASALPAVGVPGWSFSWPNCVSADGRYFLFYSTSRNLVTNAVSGAQNLFVRDLWTGETRLVTATPQGTDCGNGVHYAPAISRNGRWAVFGSTATNLVPADVNNYADIFVRDLWYGTNCIVDVPSSLLGTANNASLNPSINSDGRLIAFQSLASNLYPLDGNGTLDAFIRDMTVRTNTPLSLSATGSSCAGGQVNPGFGVVNPYAPILQPNGDWVLLWSTVNLTTSANLSGLPYCFARNIRTRQTVPVGILTNNIIQTANRSASLGADGRFAAFGNTNNLVGVFDFATQTSSLAARAAWSPTISADARWLAFEGRAADHGTNSGNTLADIFVLDRTTGIERLVSFSTSGPGGNGASSQPLISGDGRYIVFKSRASDLVPGDANGYADVFVRDLVTGAIFALSGRSDGATGSGLSGNPALGPDGRTVLFESHSPDLASGDFNGARDVFVLRLPGDVASELRVLTLTSLAAGSVTIYWNSIPGRTYRLEYKEALTEGPWTELPGEVVATGYTSAKNDPVGGQPARFYRVKML